MKLRSVAIVGLGLMGSSLGAALRRRAPRINVIGVSRSAVKIREAKRQKIIHAGSTSLAKAVSGADLIVICTPVRTIPDLVREIDSVVRHKVVVTDVGSTKTEIMSRINLTRLRNVRFVGSHPMAGSHRTGLQAADACLYDHAWTFVVKSKHATAEDISLVLSFWRTVGTRVKMVSPGQHDEIASSISQLPHLLAVELVNSVSRQRLSFVGPGFRDVTRIAEGDPKLWLDILMSNRNCLAKGLKTYASHLRKTAQRLARSDNRWLLKRLSNASRLRSGLSANRK